MGNSELWENSLNLRASATQIVLDNFQKTHLSRKGENALKKTKAYDVGNPDTKEETAAHFPDKDSKKLPFQESLK